MKGLFTLLTLTATVFFADADAGEAGLPRFFLDYAIVNHSLKNDEGAFNELMDLAKLDQKSADFIAEFWWGKANSYCDDYVDKLIRQYSAKITPKTSEREKIEITEAAKKEADQCFYGFYYDQWDEINKMIREKYGAVKKAKK
jgi:hypothetical protein